MSNKSRLQTNNENLQSLIDKANQLPNAGGGGSVETVTGTLEASAQWGTEGTLYYIDEQQQLRELTNPPSTTIKVVKNSIVFLYYTGTYTEMGEISVIPSDAINNIAFYVTGDFTLYF